MTDFDDIPNAALFAAECGTITALLDANGLNEAGLAWAWNFVRRPDNLAVTTPTGNLAIVREQLTERVITARSRATGVPAQHWRDQLLVDVPDDLSGLDQ